MKFFSSDHYGSNDFATFYLAVNVHSTSKALDVCQLLDITPKTLKAYLSGKSDPPKAMVRLLFHECHFGRSATDAHAHEGFLIERRRAAGLQSEIDRMKAALSALELENDALKRDGASDTGHAANSPRWRA